MPHGSVSFGYKSKMTPSQRQQMNASRQRSELNSRRSLDAGPKRYSSRPQTLQQRSRKVTQPVVFTPPVIHSPKHSPYNSIRSKNKTPSPFRLSPSGRFPAVVHRDSYTLQPSPAKSTLPPRKRSISRKMSSPRVFVGSPELETAMDLLSMNSSYSYVYSQPSGTYVRTSVFIFEGQNLIT